MTSLPRIIPCLALLLPLTVACFDDDPKGDGDDAGAAADTGHAECTSDTGCAAGSKCFFEIGSCTAKGECFVFPAPGNAGCNAIEDLCGCNGTMVTTGCDAPSGYATGPTAGAHACSDTDAGSDAGMPSVSCESDATCGAGEHCYFEIGHCSAIGQCIKWPLAGAAECNSVEDVCGCDGMQVFAGCVAPNGFATGPTTGEPGQSCIDAGAP
jgi:hypothetical protein